MDAIVPAAGLGTRLRPLTDDRPKPLVEVAGRPLLAHVFDALAPTAPDSYVVVVGYEGDAIRERFGDDYRGTPIEYVCQERRRGLAHAVLQAAAAVDGDCLVCNGDNAFGASLAPLWETHRERAVAVEGGDDSEGGDPGEEYVGTMLTEAVSVERAREVGAIETTERGEMARVVEKPDEPPSTLVSAGAFAFGQPVFEACRSIEPADTGEYELADAITWLVEQGYRVGTRPYDGERVNVNEPDDVERAARVVSEAGDE